MGWGNQSSGGDQGLKKGHGGGDLGGWGAGSARHDVDEEGGGGVRPATGGWRAAGSGPEPVGASGAGLRTARVCARSK
jgi:hypothetical protein